MEVMIYQSPKKHRIIAVKKLLSENNIPTSNIKLHIYVEWYHRKVGTGETIEKRDEINIDIEDFVGKLNDAQTFELYIDEKYEEMAMVLIDNINVETFFDDYVFKSNSYDEAIKVYKLLKKNNISCDEIYATFDNYLVITDLEDKNMALSLINPKNEEPEYLNEFHIQKPIQHSTFYQESEKNYIFKYIFPIIVIIGVLFIKMNNEFIIIKLINVIKNVFERFVNNIM